MNARSFATALGSAFLLLASHANASTITTTNVTTWKSSTFINGSYSTLNFYPVLADSYNTSAGITLAPANSTVGFTFTGPDQGAWYLAGDRSNKTLSSSTDAGAYINIAFGANQNAFLIGTNAATSPLIATLSDGEVFHVTTTVFGLSVSHPISWLQLSAASGSQAMINDFWFAASALPQDAPGGGTPAPTAPTPEPATIIMTCAGALLLLTSSGNWKFLRSALHQRFNDGLL